MIKLNDFTVEDCIYCEENNINNAIRQLQSNKNIILKEEDKYYTLNIVETTKNTFVIKKEKQIKW